jgi:hypothetical protein
MNSTPHPRWHRRWVINGAVQLTGFAVALGALAACARRPIVVQAPPTTVVQNTPAPQPVVGTVTRDVIVVKEAPPPPREEALPPPPSTSYTWVPGYWMAREGRQEWVAGRYEMPPRVGATWVPPRWERRADGYVFSEGYWR